MGTVWAQSFGSILQEKSASAIDGNATPRTRTRSRASKMKILLQTLAASDRCGPVWPPAGRSARHQRPGHRRERATESYSATSRRAPIV